MMMMMMMMMIYLSSRLFTWNQVRW